MLNKHTAIKYETPYTGPVVITRCFANGMVNLQCYEIQIKYNIHRIKPYKSDANIEDINPENISDDVNI